MSKALISVLLLAFLATVSIPANLAAAGESVDTTVLSFNIRYGQADDGLDSWPYRQEQVCATVAVHEPAIFGVQECLWEQATVLREAFPGYDFTGVGRDDGLRAGEMCAIFTDRARYEVMDSGVFWLSETPEVVASRGWDAALHRIASWVKLRDKVCRPEIVYVFNTHFDHIGTEARSRSARLLKERIAAIAGDNPSILMGDFNADAEGSAPHDVLANDDLRDTWTCASSAEKKRGVGTFHGFRGETSRGRIDWILTTPDLPCVGAGIDRSSTAGRYPSDHYPVWASLRQEKRPELAGQSSGPLVEHINPFIGTGGHGHTFPGPTLPFGMVQLSPDTRLAGWDGCSLYHDSDRIVFGFSHTHLSGTGVGDYGDILLMPCTGTPFLQNGYPDQPDQGYGSRFDKADERAAAGYYRTFLDDYSIEVELTSTPRTGLHRYVFPADQLAHVIVDLEHRDELLDVDLEIIDDHTVAGFRRSQGWARDQLVHFRAIFSRPFTAVLEPGPGALSDRSSKAVLSFGPPGETGGEVLVQVAISAVDAEGALRNLEAEWADFDFAGTREAARRAWSEVLEPYEVEGASADDLTVLATALYHSFIAPNLFTDVDGRYRGMDREVHRAEGREQYTVFSLWDTYRATHPLFSLVQRERTRDFVNTALSHYREGGRLPVWELAGNETDCMIGYHSVSFIADAWLKGIGGFDPDLALEGMIDSARRDHFGLDAYRRDGFIAADEDGESVSKTLEYSYDDACIARMARSIGEEAIAVEFDQRAHAWRNLFDPISRCFRPRRNGQWLKPYDPRQVDSHHTEANGWQYRFGAPHHMPQHVEMLGGEEECAAVLDSLFTTASGTIGRDQPDITGRMGQYAHGNEPSHHMAWLYHFAGRPDESAARVGRILREFYTPHPDGLIGNEDCGQMSSWYVLAAFGLYDVAPTSQQWLVIPPLHRRMSMAFEDGRVFTTRREGTGRIAGVTFNGKPLLRSWLNHDEVISGGELVFTLNEGGSWGAGLIERPGTNSLVEATLTAPWAEAPADAFRGSMAVELRAADPEAEIYWTDREDLDLTADPEVGNRYIEPILLEARTRLLFVARTGDRTSRVMTAEFHTIPNDWKLQISSRTSTQYTGGGSDGLIDGRRGPDNWRNGGWHGYEDQDFVAVLDLGEPVRIRRAGASFLQDLRSWILMPRELLVETSTDGEHFVPAAKVSHDVSAKEYGIFRKDLTVRLSGEPVRFLRFRATSYGSMPQWHSGAGGKSFIFIDELIVESEPGELE